jgi:hypothetical protein
MVHVSHIRERRDAVQGMAAWAFSVGTEFQQGTRVASTRGLRDCESCRQRSHRSCHCSDELEYTLRVRRRSGRRFAPSFLWRGWKPRPSTFGLSSGRHVAFCKGGDGLENLLRVARRTLRDRTQGKVEGKSTAETAPVREEVNGRQGAKYVCRAQHAVPLRMQNGESANREIGVPRESQNRGEQCAPGKRFAGSSPAGLNENLLQIHVAHRVQSRGLGRNSESGR